MTELYKLMTEQKNTHLIITPCKAKEKAMVHIECVNCENAQTISCEVDLADLHKVLRKISMF